MGHDGTRQDTTGHKMGHNGRQGNTMGRNEARGDTALGHDGTQNGTQGDVMGHEGTQWDALPKDWRGQLGIQHLGSRRDTMGHPTPYLRNRRERLDTARWDTTGHVGTCWHTTKSGTKNLGHKIWDTKLGTESLGRKIWDTKWETRDTTPYLRIGGDTLGYSTLGHVGTRWDTMGKMGEDGIQWDTRHLILGTGGNTLPNTARWDTLGHDGTRQNLGHEIWDKGTQHLTLGLEGTCWDTARWDTMGHNGEKWDTTGHNGTQHLRLTLGLEGTRGIQHVGTRWDTTGHKIRDAKSGTRNLGQKIWDTKWETRGHNTLPEDWKGHVGIQHVGTRWDTMGHNGENGRGQDTMGHPTPYLRRREHVGIQHVGTRWDTTRHENWTRQTLGHKIWD